MSFLAFTKQRYFYHTAANHEVRAREAVVWDPYDVLRPNQHRATRRGSILARLKHRIN